MSSSWKSVDDVDLYWRLPIAVYGTLRSGGGNHVRFLADNSAVLSMVPATVYGFELHAYTVGLPVVIPRRGSSITVEVVTIDNRRDGGDQLRDDLDRLESFRPYSREPSGIYDRVLAEATTAEGDTFDCWLYAAGDAVDLASLGEHTRVVGGDWCQR